MKFVVKEISPFEIRGALCTFHQLFVWLF